jgi:tetratricopeptide (TPR) repeat protein
LDLARPWRRRAALLAIVVAYAALYARAVAYDFVWDDIYTLRDSDFFDRPLVEQLRATEAMRQDPANAALRGIVPGHESYRPITLLDQDIDVALFGRLAPEPMHVHGLVFGAIAILLAYAIARRLFASTPAALVVAAIFALHPLHVEPFAYISARADLVAGALALASLALACAPPRRSLAVAAVLWLVSLFAKESTIGLPVVALLVGVARGDVRARRVQWLAFAVALVCYFGLRALLIPDAAAATRPELALHGALALPSLTLQYLGSFVLPLDISIARMPSLPVAVGLVATAAIAAAIVVVRRRRALGTDIRLAAAWLAGAVVLLGPSAVAVATLGAMADRYAYLCVLAFAIAAVALGRAALRRIPRARAVILGVAALWGALCVFVTWREIPYWASNEQLYAHAVEVEPESAMARFRLGILYVNAGAWREATQLFEQAAALDPSNDRVLNNLGVGYMNTGRLDDAERVLRRALDITHETSFRAWYNLATIQRGRGQRDAACASYRRALAINPQYAKARADYARSCQ